MGSFLRRHYLLTIFLSILLFTEGAKEYCIRIDQWMYSQQVQWQVDRNISKIIRQNKEVIHYLERVLAPTFEELNHIRIGPETPYYIFKDKHLYYWSKANMIPDYSALETVD
ncbi:MAG: hypothetical protein MUE33_06600, partial [Cytophagaceae bacterium]|nr:hypothetical protein [Cytophagaceae bacterium]